MTKEWLSICIYIHVNICTLIYDHVLVYTSLIIFTVCNSCLNLDGNEENENETDVEKEKPQRKRKVSFC